MVVAYHEMLERLRENDKIKNLRTAAFLNAIEKVAQSYLELGIFP